MESETEPSHRVRPPHVLVFPLPLQGPLSPMFKLAELLCLAGVDVTFLVTDVIHRRLTRNAAAAESPRFRIRTISDGLPADHPRDKYLEVFDSLRSTGKGYFRQFLMSRDDEAEGSRGPVTCVVADGILRFAFDVAEDVGIPILSFRAFSPACLSIFFCLPKLIQSQEIPFSGNDNLDELIKNVPGTESFLRRRDMPEFCRSGDISDPRLTLYVPEEELNARANGLILNTFEELDGPTLSQIRKICPNLYAIGPLHAHLKTKLLDDVVKSPITTSSSSLWQEDRSCIEWLDNQPLKSVLYVSFGSIVTLSKDQLMEFWYGLVNSGHRFLWAIRPDSVAGDDWKSHAPAELAEGTKERGYIVGWAPQEEVLAHPAVRGFLTHSGWNSTLESIYEGIPMICLPNFLDQQVNSRFVETVYELGLDMKDTCDRVTIERMVRELMDGRKYELLQRAKKMGELAKSSILEGGSSYTSFERLVNDIKTWSFNVHYLL